MTAAVLNEILRLRLTVNLHKEGREARARYEATGELQNFDQAPTVWAAWHAAQAAVAYATPLAGSREALPKRFFWMGVELLLLFPAEGPVQILDHLTHENHCAGFFGWCDPMKAEPHRGTQQGPGP